MDTEPQQPLLNNQAVLAHFQALEAQIQQLQLQLQLQEQQTPAQSTPVPISKTKVPAPQPFFGKRDQVKPFISGLTIYIRLRPQEFPTEEIKILFSASLLRGTAYDWFRPYEQSLNSGPVESSFFTITSFHDFCDQLTRTFGDPDEGLTASSKLYKLHQTRSVTEYVAEFQRLSSQLDWNESALRDTFFQGLQPHIQGVIIRGTMPETIRELIRIACNLDNRMLTPREYHYDTPQQRPSYDPDPMDLDALHLATQASKPRGPLSKQEKQHRRDNNLCLYCGKPGHSVNTCSGVKYLKSHQA